MSDVPILDVQDVSFVLHGKRILDGVDWQIRRGEHWAVLGPNGAGKTTLLRMLCGYLWPNAGGRILRGGRELLDLCELRERIGWVSSDLCERIPRHEPALQTVLSGKFAQIGLWEYGEHHANAADRDRAGRYLRDLGAGGVIRQAFGSLSQGEKQKVLIARARMAGPLLVILDEPCAGLDPGARERFLHAVNEMATNTPEAGFVLVTHHVEEIMPAFGRTLVMAEGRVVAAGATADVVTRDALEALYGLRVELVRRAGRAWAICGNGEDT